MHHLKEPLHANANALSKKQLVESYYYCSKLEEKCKQVSSTVCQVTATNIKESSVEY